MKKIAVLLAALAVWGVCEVIPATSNMMNTTVVANAQACTVYTVKENGARVRKSKSTNSTILGLMYRGNSICVVSDDGTWVKFLYGNGYAYMSRSLVENTHRVIYTN